MSKKQDRMRGSTSPHVKSGSEPYRKPSTAANSLRISPTIGGAWDCRPMTLSLAEVRDRYAPPHTLGTPDNVRMACDEQLEASGVYSLLQHSFSLGQMPQAQFMGYGTLQQIAQNGMVRACIETIADDMTRNWIELKREGESEKSEHEDYLQSMGVGDPEAEKVAEEQLSTIQAEMQRINLQRVFHDAVSLVGYMGGCLIFIDTGETDPERLREPLNISTSSYELQKDRPLRFIALDPINVFPGLYNSINPLQEDYFKPKTWWILGQEVHSSRLLRLVANEVPVLLKPAYNFLGIAQAQILWDYVMHFQECRVASQRLLSKFSLTVFKTDMQDVLFNAASSENLDRRISLLVRNRSNDGVEAIDKEEEVLKLETPLSGVTDIVRQSLEILAAINRTPAVKLLGISPSGFNATGESDIRNYYDHILSQQEKIIRPALNTVLDILQVRLFGKKDKTITFDFAALSEDDSAAIANTQKLRADTMAILIDRQIVSNEECRRVLADDPDSGFADIDVDDIPEPLAEGELGPENMAGFAGGNIKSDPVSDPESGIHA